MSRAIDISDLPQPLIEAIETIVRAYRERGESTAATARAVGWGKGVAPELPDSFFEPLPPDVLDGFEGRAA